MTPTKFPGSNIVFAENQPEYLPLPAHKAPDGTVICCWQGSWKERLKFLFTGRMYLELLTFNQPLQPNLLLVDNPIKPVKPAKRFWHWGFGFFKHGNCWKPWFHINRYHTCTYYHFWRFFVSVDTK